MTDAVAISTAYAYAVFFHLLDHVNAESNMRSFVHASGGIILFAAMSNLAAAANLLPNGDFSSANQINGWMATIGAISWNSDDAAGDGSSGSLQIDFVGTGSAFSTCFTVQAGAAYIYGGQSRLVAGGAADSFVCYSYDTTNCTGTATGLTGPIISQGITWPAPTSDGGTLSNTAKSGRCNIQTAGNPTLGSMSSRFDNLFFESTVPTPVRLQTFNVE